VRLRPIEFSTQLRAPGCKVRNRILEGFSIPSGEAVGRFEILSRARAAVRTKVWMGCKRSDIRSFGVILYEVLTGKKVFPGETPIEILAGVLNREPDISAAPPRAHELLRWCLEKDRKGRLQSIGDARRLLAEDIAPTPVAMEARPSWKHPLVWALASTAVASLVVAVFALRSQPTVLQKTGVHLTIPLPPGQEVTDYPAVSRDGRTRSS
jgi:serine/threonine protein kinase